MALGPRTTKDGVQPMRSSVISLLKFIGSRTVLVYVALFLVSLALVDFKEIRNRMNIRTLNDNMPASFAVLIKLGEDASSVKPDEKVLHEYINYFEKVVHFFPKMAEAHGMLGVSYFYLGDMKKALSSVQKAAVLNSHFFWFHYNLGVIYFANGDYGQSAQVLAQARQLRPQIALLVIKQSTEYQRVLHGVTNLGDIIMAKLKSGYSDTYRLLVLSHLKRQEYADAIRYAQEAISLGLNYKEMFLFYIAQASYELKHYESSVKLLKEALTIDPQYSEAVQLLGQTLKAMQQDQMAEELLTRANFMIDQGLIKHPTPEEVRVRIL